MNNSYWAEKVNQLADEALASGQKEAASSLKSLAASLYAGVEVEFMHHCAIFSQAMLEELKKIETSRYN